MNIAINNIGNNRLIDESQPQKPYFLKSTLVENKNFPAQTNLITLFRYENRIQ